MISSSYIIFFPSQFGPQTLKATFIPPLFCLFEDISFIFERSLHNIHFFSFSPFLTSPVAFLCVKSKVT